jgi:hypothetical protein
MGPPSWPKRRYAAHTCAMNKQTGCDCRRCAAVRTSCMQELSCLRPLSSQQTTVLSRSSCCRTTRRLRKDAGQLAVVASWRSYRLTNCASFNISSFPTRDVLTFRLRWIQDSSKELSILWREEELLTFASCAEGHTDLFVSQSQWTVNTGSACD